MSIAAASKVKTAPSPASSGTTLSVDDDTFDRFPDPPFDALAWKGGSVPDIGVDAEEIVVSVMNEDDWTITRAAAGSRASIEVGWLVAALRERSSYSRDVTVTLTHTFTTANPPYTIHTRAPDGAAGSAFATNSGGGTATYSFDPDKSGVWFYRFSDLDEVGPERDFYVRHTAVL